jgi:hypothetical protein
MDFLRRLRDIMTPLWPPTTIRIMRRGAELARAFRLLNDKEPTEEEWRKISKQVEMEVF